MYYRENVFKNFIVHIEAAARRENKSQGVLHAKKAAFLFIDSFLSSPHMYENISSQYRKFNLKN